MAGQENKMVLKGGWIAGSLSATDIKLSLFFLKYVRA